MKVPVVLSTEGLSATTSSHQNLIFSTYAPDKLTFCAISVTALTFLALNILFIWQLLSITNTAAILNSVFGSLCILYLVNYYPHVNFWAKPTFCATW